MTVGQVIARIVVGGEDGPTAAPAEGDGTPAADGGTRRGGWHRRPARLPRGRARGGRRGRRPRTRLRLRPGGAHRQGRRALRRDGNGGPAAPAPSAPAGEPAEEGTPAGAELLRGGAAALARYMELSRSVPTATSFRTLTVTALDARRRELKAAGLRVSFTHLIAYALALAAADMPVMADHFAELDGRPHRVRDGQVNLGLAVDVEKRDGSRTLMVPVIRDAARLPFDRFVAAYDALVERARTGALTADDLAGANVTLTNPGGLGTAASVPRLMSGQGTILAIGAIGYPPGLAAIGASLGAEKVMTMTSTYDHRVIQGAESGRFLGLIEERLHGEHGFYEQAFAALGVEPTRPGRRRRATSAGPRARRRARAGQVPAPGAEEAARAAAPRAAPDESCCRRCSPRPRC